MSFKVARYKCCRNIVMSCVSGMEDEEIERDFSDYAAKGLVVETIESMDGEKFAKCSCEKISRAEYDRLLAVEGEYQRLRAILDDQTKLLELMVRYPKLISNGEHKPECTCLVCRARAAIARAKGEKK